MTARRQALPGLCGGGTSARLAPSFRRKVVDFDIYRPLWIDRVILVRSR